MTEKFLDQLGLNASQFDTVRSLCLELHRLRERPVRQERQLLSIEKNTAHLGRLKRAFTVRGQIVKTNRGPSRMDARRDKNRPTHSKH